jgi:hypothetical protein
VACDPTTAGQQQPPPPAIGSAESPPAARTGPTVDRLLEAAESWQRQMAGTEVVFDGHCGTHLTRLVAMESLADFLREGLATLSTADRATFYERLRATKPQVMANVDAMLKRDLSKTRADLVRSEAAIQDRCLNDARFQADTKRIGLEIAKPPWALDP